MIQNLDSKFVKDYLNHLLEGDKKKCSLVVKEYLALNSSLLDLYEKVFKPSLYEVGRLWETNKISVAKEHMATAITEGILNELFQQINPTKKYNKKIVVSCVENEKHQVGIKMVADLFEMKGWDSFFLGSGIPVSELISFIKEVKPDMLAISLSVYFNYSNLVHMLQKISTELPDLFIIIGGQALEQMDDESFKESKNILCIPDLYLLEKYIDSINS